MRSRAFMSRSVAGGLWLWLIGGVVTACSSSSEKRSLWSTDDFVAEVCEEQAPCCAAAGLPTDEAACGAAYAEAFRGRELAREGADACLDAYRASANRCATPIWDTPPCDALFATGDGSRGPGEACETDDDCSRPEEDGFALCTGGSCLGMRRGAEGSSPCIGNLSGAPVLVDAGDLSLGYVCDLSKGIGCDKATGACRKLPSAGEPCLSGLFCADSDYCSLLTQTCKRGSATGEVCEDGACPESDFCESATHTCTAKLMAGAACVVSSQCASDSCGDGKCLPPAPPPVTVVCGR